MIFDVYYPIRTKNGELKPGVKPVPKDWNWIRTQLLNDVEYVGQLEKYRETKDVSLKQSLPCINFVGKSTSTRKKSAMIPTQLFMIDIDHVSESHEDTKAVWESFKAKMGQEWLVDHVALAHISPSYGIHIFMFNLGYRTILENMEEADRICNFGQYGDYDKVCKDYSRVSFMFSHSDLLFENARLLMAVPFESFDPEWQVMVNDDFDGEQGDGVPTEDRPADGSGFRKSNVPLSQQVPVLNETDIEEYKKVEYRGIPVTTIIKKWVEVQGSPGPGEVHNYYNEMVKYFRHITNNDKRTLFALLPRFEHSAEECWGSIVSICRVNTLSKIDKPFYFFLKDNGFYVAKEHSSALKDYMMADDDLSKVEIPPLPPVFREFVGAAPTDFKIPTINALMPIMGTLSSYVEACYEGYDDKWHTTSFFSIIYAPAGTGKSFVGRLTEPLLRKIEERDKVSQLRENIYLRVIGRKGANEKAPELPHVSLRIIPPKNSEAEFLTKMEDNQGYHMFTFAPEMDAWAKGEKAAGGNKSDMIRMAWDNDEYGQYFKSANTFRGKVALYWNVLITGTMAQILSYFKNVENGLVTRCAFSTIENQEFSMVSRWRKMSKRNLDVIEKYVERCDANTYVEPCTVNIAEASVMDDDDFVNNVEWRFQFKPRKKVDLSWILPTIDRFNKEQCDMAALAVDRARDVFRRRVAVRGFRLALLCTTLYNQITSKEKKIITDFVWWWMHIDIKNHLHLWGEKYNEVAECEVSLYNRNVFAQLADEFGKEDLYVICRRENIKSPLRQILYNWKKSKHIEQISKDRYRKVIKKKK